MIDYRWGRPYLHVAKNLLVNQQVFSGFELLTAVLLKIEVFYRRFEQFAFIFNCKQSKKSEETLFESLHPDKEGTAFVLNCLPVDTA